MVKINESKRKVLLAPFCLSCFSCSRLRRYCRYPNHWALSGCLDPIELHRTNFFWIALCLCNPLKGCRTWASLKIIAVHSGHVDFSNTLTLLFCIHFTCCILTWSVMRPVNIVSGCLLHVTTCEHVRTISSHETDEVKIGNATDMRQWMWAATGGPLGKSMGFWGVFRLFRASVATCTEDSAMLTCIEACFRPWNNHSEIQSISQ